MINKKAQGEIITTVLIILLVLAAIVIVWQVVNSTVNRAGEQADIASQCVGIQLYSTVAPTGASGASANVKLTLTRGNDPIGVGALKLKLSNATNSYEYTNSTVSAIPTPGNTKEVSFSFSNIGAGGYKAELMPVIGNVQCEAVYSTGVALA